jgi:hypothetical protein
MAAAAGIVRTTTRNQTRCDGESVAIEIATLHTSGADQYAHVP